MAFHDSSAMHLEPSASLQFLPMPIRVDRCYVVTVIKIHHSASPNVQEELLAVYTPAPTHRDGQNSSSGTWTSDEKGKSVSHMHTSSRQRRQSHGPVALELSSGLAVSRDGRLTLQDTCKRSESTSENWVFQRTSRRISSKATSARRRAHHEALWCGRNTPFNRSQN